MKSKILDRFVMGFIAESKEEILEFASTFLVSYFLGELDKPKVTPEEFKKAIMNNTDIWDSAQNKYKAFAIGLIKKYRSSIRTYIKLVDYNLIKAKLDQERPDLASIIDSWPYIDPSNPNKAKDYLTGMIDKIKLRITEEGMSNI